MEIQIQTRLSPKTPPDSRFWEPALAAAESLLTELRRPDAEVSVLLVDDPAIHELNRQWRGYDKPTDVLSWPLDEQFPAHSGEDALGDVVISFDTAERQARARGWSAEEETALLLVHGILHLVGHEDDSEAGSDAMKEIEKRILGKPLDKVDAVAEQIGGAG
jgi:probable rRNA maturation factor